MIPNFEKIEFVEFLSKNPKRIYEGGNRFKNLPRKRNDPLISIITVSKNSSKFVKETLDSIKNQKYENIEYIVIDGASSDGTIDIIKENIDFIDYFVSEPDLGNYDAINKGLSLCTGDLIGIVNADDILLPDATSILIKYYKNYPDADFYFGSVKKHWGVISGYYPRKIKYSWFFYTSHSTGFFVKKNSAKKIGKYSLKYKYSSDFDYFYRMIIHNKLKGVATKKDEIFGIFRPGGISATLDKEYHFFEKIRIRIDNKQNRIFLIVLYILKIIKNFMSNNRKKVKIEFKKLSEFFFKNFL